MSSRANRARAVPRFLNSCPRRLQRPRLSSGRQCGEQRVSACRSRAPRSPSCRRDVVSPASSRRCVTTHAQDAAQVEGRPRRTSPDAQRERARCHGVLAEFSPAAVPRSAALPRTLFRSRDRAQEPTCSRSRRRWPHSWIIGHRDRRDRQVVEGGCSWHEEIRSVRSGRSRRSRCACPARRPGHSSRPP